jgi:hypothetical protein
MTEQAYKIILLTVRFRAIRKIESNRDQGAEFKITFKVKESL